MIRDGDGVNTRCGLGDARTGGAVAPDGVGGGSAELNGPAGTNRLIGDRANRKSFETKRLRARVGAAARVGDRHGIRRGLRDGDALSGSTVAPSVSAHSRRCAILRRTARAYKRQPVDAADRRGVYRHRNRRRSTRATANVRAGYVVRALRRHDDGRCR